MCIPSSPHLHSSPECRWGEHAPAGKPAVMAAILEAAAMVAWALVSYGGPRSVLVGAGLVPELVSALRKAQEWRKAAVACGEAAAAAANAAQKSQTEEALAELACALAEAEKAEAAAAAKSTMSPELDAAIEATDRAADALNRCVIRLPNNHSIMRGPYLAC